MLRTRLIIGRLLSLTLSACGTDAGGRSDDIQIVVSTTVLGDVVANVTGPDASVVILMPTGADPHDYQASARQVAALNQADIVFVNGLGLEAALDDVLESAAADGANILEVAPLLEPLPFGDGDSDDPHVWMDPTRMAKAATIIAQSLTSLDDSVDWKSRADAYGTRLDATDKEIEGILAAIPERDRKLVTNHDSLAYLADRYDFVVVGTVVPGGSTLGDPSSEELAQLVRASPRRSEARSRSSTSTPGRLELPVPGPTL
jgi:zinc/manganese transport system substrate-binding protein